jgi:hypothetical protein
MPLTADPTEVTQAIVDVLEANKLAIGLADVYYGAQNLKPTFPSAECASMPTDRDIVTTRQFSVTFRVGITAMFGKIGDVEANTKGSEELVEAIKNKLHEDFFLGGLVIFGYVARTEPGVAVRAGTPIRATRLVWTAESREAF